ncbi:MAG: hypothetical protein PHD06_02725 [Bacteroidales bacterium]|nr:hypothetical protein [Bacteroidales bacterium]MDD4384071.1 hypothetical protein [Bacteroidales bacterium]MDY0198163.1 hypothetical protein [Tenuifilaceae bacterium]
MQIIKQQNILLLTLLCVFSIKSFSQEKRVITFYDGNGKPIEDVIVHFKGGNTTISNEQGVIYLNPSISMLTCHRLGYRDTVVVLKRDIPNNTISLNKEAQIEEVTVAKRYNPRKHLIRLRNDAHQLYKGIDTTIFYQYTIRMENPKTDEKSELQGTVRVLTRATMRWPSIFICSIDSFYSSPSMNDSLNFRWCNMRNLLNENILHKRNYRWKNITNKKFNFYRDWSVSDSIIFNVSLNRNTNFASNIIFNQDKLKSFEWYSHVAKGLNTKEYNLFMQGFHTYIEYSSAEIPYPSTLRQIIRYQTRSREDWVCMVAMTEIESPCNCEYDAIDNRYFFNLPIKEQVERIDNHLQNR